MADACNFTWWFHPQILQLRGDPRSTAGFANGCKPEARADTMAACFIKVLVLLLVLRRIPSRPQALPTESLM